MKSAFKFTIWLSALMLIFFGCSMPEDPTEQLTIENQTFALTLDREKFDFTGLNETVSLDSQVVGEDLTIEAIIDSSDLLLGDLRIEEVQFTKNIDLGISVPGGTEIPEQTASETTEGIPEVFNGGQSQFKWAQVDTGHFFIKMENNVNGVNYDQIRFVLTNNEETVIFDESTTLQANSSSTLKIPLDNQYLTDNMTMNTSFIVANYTPAQDVESKMNMNFVIGECSVDSAKAKFYDQVLINDSLYTVAMDNIIANKVIAKDAQIMLKIKNESNFKLEVQTQIDSLYNLRSNNLVQLDRIDIDPNQNNFQDPFVYDLDSNLFSIEHPDPADPLIQGVNFRSVTSLRSPDENDEFADVVFVQGQRAKFYYVIANTGPEHDQQEDFAAYMIKGRIENDTIEYEEKSEKFGEDEDFSWSDYEGIQLETLDNAKLILDISSDSLIIEKLQLSDFHIQGVKYVDGIRDTSETYTITTDPEILEDINGNGNKDTLLIRGLKDVINFHPDSIIYSLNSVLTSEGTIFHNDYIAMDLELGVPFSATITETVITSEGDIRKIEAIADDEDIDIEVLSLYLNSFINNPSVKAKALLNINISDTYDEEADTLAGDVKKMLSVFLSNNPQDKPDGYMLHELDNSNTDAFEMDENGISIAPELFQMMMDTTTYMQQEIILYPSQEGDTITMQPQDFIEVQLKLQTNLKTTIDM